MESSVLSPGVVIRPGAVVRESIILTDSVIESGAVIERAIIDRRCHIGRMRVWVGESQTQISSWRWWARIALFLRVMWLSLKPKLVQM